MMNSFKTEASPSEQLPTSTIGRNPSSNTPTIVGTAQRGLSITAKHPPTSLSQIESWQYTPWTIIIWRSFCRDLTASLSTVKTPSLHHRATNLTKYQKMISYMDRRHPITKDVFKHNSKPTHANKDPDETHKQCRSAALEMIEAGKLLTELATNMLYAGWDRHDDESKDYHNKNGNHPKNEGESELKEVWKRAKACEELGQSWKEEVKTTFGSWN